MQKGRIPQRGEIWHLDPSPIAGRKLKYKHYCIVITIGEINRALDLNARKATFETVAEDTLLREVIFKLTNLIDPQ